MQYLRHFQRNTWTFLIRAIFKPDLCFGVLNLRHAVSFCSCGSGFLQKVKMQSHVQLSFSDYEYLWAVTSSWTMSNHQLSKGNRQWHLHHLPGRFALTISLCLYGLHFESQIFWKFLGMQLKGSAVIVLAAMYRTSRLVSRLYLVIKQVRQNHL